MYRHLLLMLILLLPCLVFSQTVTWDRTYNNKDYDKSRSIKPTIDNGFIVAGRTGSIDSTDIYILKLNESGDTVWTKTIGDPGCEEAYSIIQTGEGNYVISGYKSPSCNYTDFYIYALKLNETGQIVWEYSYPGGNRTGYDIVETYDGGYLILGINYAFTAEEIILIKLNQDGQFVWDKKYDFQSSPNLMYEVIQTQDSGFIFVGERMNKFEQDIWIMKTNKYGDSTWSKTINYQDHDAAYSIKQLENGDFIVAANGGINKYGQNHLLTYKLDSSGEIDWVKSYSKDNAYFSSSSIISTNDGNFLTTGSISKPVGGKGIFLFKQNSLGDSIWLRTFERGVFGGSSEIHQTSDEGYIISGYVSNNGSGSDVDIWVLKLNESGLVKTKSELHLPQNSITVFPNPANDFVFCSVDTPNISNNSIDIEIYSMDFKLQKRFPVQLKIQENNIFPLSISGLSSGTYIISVELDNEIITKKIVISKK